MHIVQGKPLNSDLVIRERKFKYVKTGKYHLDIFDDTVLCRLPQLRSISDIIFFDDVDDDDAPEPIYGTPIISIYKQKKDEVDSSLIFYGLVCVY